VRGREAGLELDANTSRLPSWRSEEADPIPSGPKEIYTCRGSYSYKSDIRLAGSNAPPVGEVQIGASGSTECPAVMSTRAAPVDLSVLPGPDGDQPLHYAIDGKRLYSHPS